MDTVEPRSRDEAMYRSGIFVPSMSDEAARLNADLRGCNMLFAADEHTSDKCNDCTKHQPAPGGAGPGLLVWV